ncbi:hypothetical protein [Aurantimonas sp. VKM B-3413]|uniref:hypothetical protein n=1 Tax=Aurantimonas sp. VKM B-3413 TaxID=2779401 RepID=UPI001E4D3B56|nr:hypothetical protein [Aurantimonas sp. VKM B-3413]MCB8837013.1 hypothetical protein [Aurantimonas sp. VKM B-3413]
MLIGTEFPDHEYSKFDDLLFKFSELTFASMGDEIITFDLICQRFSSHLPTTTIREEIRSNIRHAFASRELLRARLLMEEFKYQRPQEAINLFHLIFEYYIDDFAECVRGLIGPHYDILFFRAALKKNFELIDASYSGILITSFDDAIKVKSSNDFSQWLLSADEMRMLTRK